MIEINLLPEELRAKTKVKKTGLDKAGLNILNIESKYFIYLIPSVLGILILIHIYLGAVFVFKAHQLRTLTNKWQSMSAQRKVLEDFNKEYSIFSSEAGVLKQLIQSRLNWAEKLNKLSLLLPSGIWFREISVDANDFNLHGSAVSLEKNEMSLIKQFMDNLKQDAGFFKYFNTLELSAVQKKTIGGYDVSEFILVGTLKSK
jgi:Tfp pilus assembly protein PilN